MLISSIIVLFAANLLGLNAQTATVDNTTTPLQQQPLDKPAGLPNVEWDILRIDAASRENLCQRQLAYCANNCGGPSEAPKNFCNATSMAWGCGCSKKVADFTPFLWPIVQAECSGKSQECQMICNKDTVNPSTCAATCNAYYQCGTDKAPPSYLQTENPNDTPSYNGPKPDSNASGNANGGSGTNGSSSSTNSQNSNNAITNQAVSIQGLLISFAIGLFLASNIDLF